MDLLRVGRNGLLIMTRLFVTLCFLVIAHGSFALVDGDPVGSWLDNSSGGHALAASGTARPTFKTNILNGWPILRFNGTTNSMNLAVGGTALTSSQPVTVIIIAKQTSKTTIGRFLDGGNGNPQRYLLGLAITTGFFQGFAGTLQSDSTDHSGAFHVLSCIFNGASSNGYVDGTLVVGPVNMGTGTGATQTYIGTDNSGTTLTGDIAEILVYSAGLSGTNRANIEAYAGNKYGLTVAGGSPVEPTSVTGLVAWWEADSLLTRTNQFFYFFP